MKKINKLFLSITSLVLLACCIISFAGCGGAPNAWGVVENYKYVTENDPEYHSGCIEFDLKLKNDAPEQVYCAYIFNSYFEMYNCSNLDDLLKNQEFIEKGVAISEIAHSTRAGVTEESFEDFAYYVILLLKFDDHTHTLSGCTCIGGIKFNAKY